MAEVPAPVDVRDMLCAQALAVVAKAVQVLPPGSEADVRYSTPDVRQDLIAWARQVGHAVEEPEAGRLTIRRQQGSHR